MVTTEQRNLDKPTDILTRLDNVVKTAEGQYSARCPAHEDGRSSLSLGVTAGGKVLLKCHAGCESHAILAELGLTMADLFPADDYNRKSKRRIVATYDYLDESNKLLMQVVRYEPKDFRQRKPDGYGSWTWSVKGVRRVPYRLPELLAADPSEVVLIPEGEKDVDRVTREGFVATCNIGGAGKWTSEESAFVGDRDVIVLPDNDSSGIKHVEAIVKTLPDAKVVELPGLPKKGDVSNWFESGGTADELRRMIREGSVPAQEWLAGKGKKATSSKPDRQVPEGSVTEADDDPIRLAKVINARRKVKFHQGEFYDFTGTKYVRHHPREFRNLHATPIIKAEFDYLWHEQQAESQDEPPPHPRKTTPRIVADATTMLESLAALPRSLELPCHLPGGDPAKAEKRNWLAVSNGILDVDEWLNRGPNPLMPHTPDWLSTACLPYKFDPDAECPKWHNFLQTNLEGDTDRICHAQQWAGLLLLPDTSYQKFLVLEGEGANGKSVFCAAIEAMLGRENCSSCGLEVFQKDFGMQAMIGKLANFARDVNQIDNVGEGHLKAVTGGDAISIPRKFLPDYEGRLTVRLVMAWNERPRFKDRTDGLWRRMHILPFRYRVPESERIRGMDQPDWWLEQGELPGILNWALRGLRSLRENGWIVSAESLEAVEEMRLEANPARIFLLDHYQEAAECYVPRQDVFEAYKKWCEQSNYKPLGVNKFVSEVLATFPGVTTARPRIGSDRPRIYENLAAKQYSDWTT